MEGKNEAAAMLGRIGGQSRSASKIEASRLNIARARRERLARRHRQALRLLSASLAIEALYLKHLVKHRLQDSSERRAAWYQDNASLFGFFNPDTPPV